VSVVLDANVWVSALKFGGKPADVVQMRLENEIKTYVSQSIIDETLRILKDKFKASEPEITRAIFTIASSATQISRT
jgi:putative PIN family toxin of toxin-antitoxin system